jgi:Domain of unknown function (DUF4345)
MSVAHERESFSAESAQPTPNTTSRFGRLAPWLIRATLVLPAVLFVLIGTKYLRDPVGTASASGMSLDGPAAVTDMRAFGAMFLAVAAVILLSLVGTRRLLAGLAVVAIVVGLVTGARVLGVLLDGAASGTLFKLVPELVLLTICALGFVVEFVRRRQRA